MGSQNSREFQQRHRSRSRNRISPAPERDENEDNNEIQERDTLGQVVPPPVPSRTIRSPRLPLPIQPEVIQSTSWEFPKSPWEIRVEQKKEAEAMVQNMVNKIEEIETTQGTCSPGTHPVSDPEIFWKEEERKRTDYLIGRVKGEIKRELFLTEQQREKLGKECLNSMKETVRQMVILEKGIITQHMFQPEVYVYYRIHKRILASKRYHSLSTNRRMEFVHTASPAKEISENLGATEVNQCTVCETVHTNTLKDKLCQQIIDNSGPRIHRYLQQSEAWKEQCEALIIGYKEYRYLPYDFSQTIINCGQLDTKGKYNPGNKSTVDKSADSLYQQVKNHLDMLDERDRTIFVEYYEGDKVSAPIQHMMGFLKVIQELQEGTWSEIVVLTAPYLPVPEDTAAEYQEKGSTRMKGNMMLEILCLAFGVPCFNIPIQAGYENTASATISRHPGWKLEPLTNRDGQVTTELLQRVGGELKTWVNYRKVFPIRYPIVEDATSETYHRYHNITDKYPSSVRYIPATGTYTVLPPRHST